MDEMEFEELFFYSPHHISAINTALLELYGENVTRYTTILDFKNAVCHSYVEEYNKQFEQRKNTTPDKKYFFTDYLKSIQMDLCVGDYENEYSFFKLTDYDNIRRTTFLTFLKGHNQKILKILIEFLSRDENKLRQIIISEKYFKAIVFGIMDATKMSDLKNELDTMKLPQPIAPMKQVQEKIDKIQWKKKLPLLAYLFYQLEEKQIIQKGEAGNLAATLAKTFIDKDYKDITNGTINSYISKLRTSNKKTQGREHIDEIITLLAEISQKL